MVVPHDHRYARVSGLWLPNERPRSRTVPAFHRSDYLSLPQRSVLAGTFRVNFLCGGDLIHYLMWAAYDAEKRRSRTSEKTVIIRAMAMRAAFCPNDCRAADTRRRAGPSRACSTTSARAFGNARGALPLSAQERQLKEDDHEEDHGVRAVGAISLERRREHSQCRSSRAVWNANRSAATLVSQLASEHPPAPPRGRVAFGECLR